MFVKEQNKEEINFLLVKIRLQVFLNWFIVIYGGPYRTISSCGASYFLTIVDDFSRAVWIYLLADKKEVSIMLKRFLAMVERQFAQQVKIFRSDNGTKFTCLKSYFFDKGIIFQTSCTSTPQQNGRVERKHQHILNIARAL